MLKSLFDTAILLFPIIISFFSLKLKSQLNKNAYKIEKQLFNVLEEISNNNLSLISLNKLKNKICFFRRNHNIYLWFFYRLKNNINLFYNLIDDPDFIKKISKDNNPGTHKHLENESYKLLKKLPGKFIERKKIHNSFLLKRFTSENICRLPGYEDSSIYTLTEAINRFKEIDGVYFNYKNNLFHLKKLPTNDNKTEIFLYSQEQEIFKIINLVFETKLLIKTIELHCDNFIKTKLILKK